MDYYKGLYLIGNGFDIHHHINSGYGHFKDWLENRDPVVFNRLFQVYDLCGGDLWSSLEENLGNIPLEAIIENYVYSPFMIFFTRADGSTGFFNLDDFSDGPVPEIGFTLQRLYFFIDQYLREWVLQLKEPDYGQKIKISIEKAFFINFNYTQTLETLYGISSNNLYYIHGCAALDHQLIFGHNQTIRDLKNNWNYNSISEGKEEIEEAIRDIEIMYKDVDYIIKKSYNIWTKISNVDTIHIWGLSLSDVDIPYIEHIKNIVKTSTKWEIQWYNEEDKVKKEEIVNNLKLNNVSWIQFKDILVKHN